MARRATTFTTLIVWLAVSTGLSLPVTAHQEPQTFTEQSITQLAWTPDGERLLVATQDGAVQQVDPTTNEVLSIYQENAGYVYDMAVASGNLVATADEGGAIRIWSPLTNQTQLVIPPPDPIVIRPITDFAWSPDQTELATVRADHNTASIFDVATGNRARVFRKEERFATVFAIDWHSGNGLLVVSSVEDSLVLDPNSLQVVVVLQPFFGAGAIIDIVWSADGSRIAGGDTDGRILIWDAATGELVQVLQSSSDAINSLSWHPFRKYLASGESAGRVSIWDTESGTLIQTLESRDRTLAVAFSPYGGRLAFGGLIRTNGAPTSQTPTEATGVSVSAFAVVIPEFVQSDLLQAIAQRCAAPSALATLEVPLAASDLEAFADAVEALPPDTIPPGCAADLEAVAAALAAG